MIVSHPERNSRIIADFDAGMTAREVASKYGLSLPRVYEIRREVYGDKRISNRDNKYEERIYKIEERLNTIEEVLRLHFRTRLNPYNH